MGSMFTAYKSAPVNLDHDIHAKPAQGPTSLGLLTKSTLMPITAATRAICRCTWATP
jgi:hypothetical protein